MENVRNNMNVNQNRELNDTQKYAIDKLILHVFGDRETYESYRNDEELNYPESYKAARNYIFRSPWMSKEYADMVIAGVPVMVKFTEKTHNQRKEDGDGSHSEAVKVDYEGRIDIAVEIQKLGKGTHAKKTAWDPTKYETYKQRISTAQSYWRRHNYNEENIYECVELYTKAYNEKFLTDFEAYHSHKRAK